MEKFDLIVIGGGSGGLTAAGSAAQLGAKTALIEKSKLGGDCLWTGCVPSKALIKSARVAHLLLHSRRFGIAAQEPLIDFASVSDHVRDVIRVIEPHDSPERFRELGIDVRFGSALFVSPDQIEVAGERLAAKKFIIATGSRPAVPPIEGLEEIDFLTNENIFDLRELPRSLVIIGGGPIGLELGQSFARFGSQVTVVEALERIIPKEEPEIAQALARRLESEGIRILTGAKVTRVEKATASDQNSEAQKIEAQKSETPLQVVIERAGESQKIPCSRVLVSVGRKANVEDLALKRAGVETTRTGIRVDSRMRTSAPNIFAVGDVTGQLQFTHVADYQAKIAVTNALLHLPVSADYSTIPWATFTDPEVARVGMTEAEAREQGHSFKIYRFPFSDVDRAVTDGEAVGFIKIIATRWRGRVLGAHILGPAAGEMIAEFALAKKNKISLASISNTVHAYPTLALGNRQAADFYFIDFLSLRLIKWIQAMFGYSGPVPRLELLKPEIHDLPAIEAAGDARRSD